MVSLVVLVGAKVAYTTEINNTCQQSMLFSFLFFFPYFNEYFTYMYGSYYNYMDTWYMDKLLLIRLNLYLNLVLSVEEWTERNREEIGLEIQSYQVILEAQNTYTSITHSFFFFNYFDYKCHRYETFTYLFVFHRFCWGFFCPDCFTFLIIIFIL